MNKHVIILSLLLASATALLFTSLQLEEGSEQIAITPSASPSPLATDASAAPVGESPLPISSTSPKPSSKPVAKPTPTPTPSPSNMMAYGIAATSPDDVLREAQTFAGRVDPFKSIVPPSLPDYEPAAAPEQLVFTPPVEVPPPTTGGQTIVVYSTPEPISAAPDPLLSEGLRLRGIVNGGIDSVAIVEVNGQSELYRAGETLPGGITITSIHYEGKYVTLSRGKQKARLVLDKEE
jgi:hypothetical protein